MTDPTEALAAMLKAAQQIEAENDNFLRAIAVIAADGRAQIITSDDSILGPYRAVICLPRKQYDRLMKLLQAEGKK